MTSRFSSVLCPSAIGPMWRAYWAQEGKEPTYGRLVMIARHLVAPRAADAFSRALAVWQCTGLNRKGKLKWASRDAHDFLCFQVGRTSRPNFQQLFDALGLGTFPLVLHTSIFLTSFNYLGHSQAAQVAPSLSLLQNDWKDSQGLQGQMKNVIPLVSPRSASGSPPSLISLSSPRQTSGGIVTRCLLRLGPFPVDAAKPRLHSKILPRQWRSFAPDSELRPSVEIIFLFPLVQSLTTFIT